MIDTNYFKTKLEEEKTKLEENLSAIAHRDPNNPEDWKTNPERPNAMISDESELADIFEESANKEALEQVAEERLNKVKAALQRIESGTYGICLKCRTEIETERLKADPTAETCIQCIQHAGR